MYKRQGKGFLTGTIDQNTQFTSNDFRNIIPRFTPEARLVFMGMKHPNPDVPAMAMANHSRELAEQLGLTGRHVFFNETWVPYQDRADLLRCV